MSLTSLLHHCFLYYQTFQSVGGFSVSPHHQHHPQAPRRPSQPPWSPWSPWSSPRDSAACQHSCQLWPPRPHRPRIPPRAPRARRLLLRRRHRRLQPLRLHAHHLRVRRRWTWAWTWKGPLWWPWRSRWRSWTFWPVVELGMKSGLKKGSRWQTWVGRTLGLSFSG